MILEPTYTPENRRIAIIYDWCRPEELNHGRLMSAWEFPSWDKQLGHLGIALSECLQVCLSPTEFPSPKTLWSSNDAVIARLREFQPTILLCVGSAAYIFGRYGPNCLDHAHDTVLDWRGSLWLSEWLGSKGISVVHPGHMVRGGTRPMLNSHYWAYQHYDLVRFVEETNSKKLDIPEHRVCILYDFQEVCTSLRQLRASRAPAAFDIEGGVNGITCYSFATNAQEATVIPLSRIDRTSVFTVEEEVEIWRLTKEWLEDVECPKILQNYLYDAFVLAWVLGIHIRGLQHDTMLMWWELFCELEKGLAVQASILTRHPFYKADRKSTDDTIAFTYCGKDSAVTFECCTELQRRLEETAIEQGGEQTCLSHYQLNLKCLMPALYMSLRGFRFDKTAVASKIREHTDEMRTLQYRINTASKREALNNIRDGKWILHNVAEKKLIKVIRREKKRQEVPKMKPHLRIVNLFGEAEWIPCPKNQVGDVEMRPVGTKFELKSVQVPINSWDDAVKWAKPSTGAGLRYLRKLYSQESMTDVDCCNAAKVLGIAVNVNSPNDVRRYLYVDCGFKHVYAKKGNKNTDRLATDVGALLTLFQSSEGDSRITDLLRYRKLAKEFTYLSTEIDHDGFLRAGLNVTGTKTGRFASYASPTGRGNIQMQNVGKRVRTLMLPPETTQMINQADLAGADSWTVAAHAALHGDPTMLNDIRERLKIQSVLALIYTHGESINRLSREELKAHCKTVDEGGWLYAAAKQVLYGSSYGMGSMTMSEHITKTSYKKGGDPVFVPSMECRAIQDKAFFVRYPGVKRWQDEWAKKIVAGVNELRTTFGHLHRFWGYMITKSDTGSKYADRQMLNHVLSIEPQLVTTYCTKLAMMKMWNDPENRRSDGSLICEPLMTVHDSLVSASPRELGDWTKSKHDQWFNNAVKVAGITLFIPYGFERGNNWGMA